MGYRGMLAERLIGTDSHSRVFLMHRTPVWPYISVGFLLQGVNAGSVSPAFNTARVSTRSCP